jgi:hypothetical protein
MRAKLDILGSVGKVWRCVGFGVLSGSCWYRKRVTVAVALLTVYVVSGDLVHRVLRQGGRLKCAATRLVGFM